MWIILAIPLGAEDSLQTQIVLNEKNKMLLHIIFTSAIQSINLSINILFN